MNLDKLTATVTAFQTWAELCEAMKTGYVPTLRKSESSGRSWNKKVETLAMAVAENGFKFYDGRRTIGGSSKY